MGYSAEELGKNLKGIRKKYASGDPLVAEFVTQARLIQLAIKKEQDALLSEIGKASKEGLAVEELSKTVADRLDKDRKALEEFSIAVKEFVKGNPDDRYKVPFSIKTQKMVEITKATIELLGHKSVLPNLLNETMPFDTSITDRLPEQAVQDTTRYWGTSKVTFCSNLLLNVSAVLTGKNVDPLNSAIVHVAPFYTGKQPPESFNNVLDALGDCSFVYTDGNGIKGLSYVHSGFSLGGARDDGVFYPNSDRDLFGPHDCASIVALGANPECLSTADLTCVYRTVSGSSDFVPEQWKIEKNGPKDALMPLYDPVKDGVQPGDLYLNRNFKEAGDVGTTLGVSGHTGVVVQVGDNNEVTFLSANRKMPDLEGVVLGTRPKTDWTNADGEYIKVMYLRHTKAEKEKALKFAQKDTASMLEKLDMPKLTQS